MSEFNTETLDPDDPLLTAYALGELDGADADHYAELVSQSPELQALVQQIQAEARMLSDELRHEPVMPLSTDRRTAILSRASGDLPTRSTDITKRRQWVRWLAIATSTAAVATIVAVSLPRPRGQDVARSMRPEAAKAAFTQHVSGGTQAGGSPFDVAEVSAKRDAVTRVALGMEEAKTGPTDGQRHVIDDLKGQVADAVVSPNEESPQREKGFGERKGVLLLADETKNKKYDAVKKTGSGPVSDRNSGGVRRGDPAESPTGGAGSSGNGEKASEPKDSDSPDDGQPTATATQPTPDSAIRVNDPQGRQPGESKGNSSDKPNSAHGDATATTARSILAAPGEGQPKGSPARVSNGGSKSPDGTAKPQTEAGKQVKSNTPGAYYLEDDVQYFPMGPEARLAHQKAALDAYKRKQESGEQKSESAKSGGKSGDKPTSSDPSGERDYSLEKREKRSDSGPSDSKPKDKNASPAKSDDDGLRSKVRESEELALLERSRPHPLPLNELQKEESAEGLERRNARVPHDPFTAEAYQPIFENPFLPAAQEQFSTFSIDVDSASYANTRRFLQSGQVPPPDSVRIEELVNYFAYQYPVPQDGKPFSVNADIAACPWNPGHNLVRIGLKGKEIPKDQRPPSSLVFLVDVSGSMAAQNKLPLVRESLKTLVRQLDERDKIAIVTYAGNAGLHLPATSVAQMQTIISAIDVLGAGGSTNGAAGINTAYDIAAKEFVEKGTNRVILCTDGDFNVGVTSDDELVKMIQTRAKGGVFLSIFGFGMGNLKDGKLQQLADKGNGVHGYIDDQQEAEKVFVHELSGTLVTIAKDVKIQIDFNKEAVAAYRLIGYENRMLATEDFQDDKKDAGEIGAGHTVTALYEIIPIKDLKADEKTRWMTVKLRFKQPEASVSELIENPLTGVPGQLKLAPTDFQFAASVASFGMLLRNSQYAGQSNWGMVRELAQTGLSSDPYGHRSGFLRLVGQAESLLGQRRPSAPPEPDSTVNGKYKSLLRRLNVPEDEKQYGAFKDYGFDKSKSYAGSDNLPEGYWVYMAPYWYIWGETTQVERK